MLAKNAIESQILINSKATDYRMDKTIEVFEYCKNVKKRFEAGSPEQKKAILQCLGMQWFLKDGTLTVKTPKYLEGVTSSVRCSWIHDPRFPTLDTRINSTHSPEERALIENGGGGGELPPSSEKALLGSTTSLAYGSDLLPCS